MASTIKLKNGSGAPLASDLVQGEPALDLTNKRLYTEDSGGDVIEVGTNPTSLTSGDITVTGTITASGEISANGGIALGDSDVATFGDGDDLQIYHDGSHSYIKDSGTGDLRFLATNLVVNNGGDTQNMFKAIDGGAVTAYYNGSAKLATTNTGIDVTGTVTADGLTVDGNIKLDGNGRLLQVDKNVSGTDNVLYYDNTVSTNDLFIGRDSSNLRLRTNGQNRLLIDSDGDISFYEDTGNTAKFFWDASAEGLNIGASSAPFGKLDISDVGGSGYATIFDGASGDNYITSGTSGIVQFRRGSTNTVKIDGSGNVGIGTSNPAYNLEVAGSFPSISILDTDTTNDRFRILHNGGSSQIQVDPNNVSASSSLLFSIDGSERMRIDSSGNVGIGTSSPATLLSGSNVAVDVGNSSGGEFVARRSGGEANLAMGVTSGNIGYLYSTTATPMVFGVNNSEAMRIDSSGNLGVNKLNPTRTVDIEGASEPLGVKLTAGSNPVIRSEHYSTADANWYHIRFFTGGGAGGAILVNGSTGTVTYSTTSDYRLKENVVDIADATDRLKQLNPVRFNWTSVPDGQAVDGFLAHEVRDIVPEAIHGEKDAVDENGDIDPQGIDQSKLVPLLTAALQEAIARIETLEAEVATLKGN